MRKLIFIGGLLFGFISLAHSQTTKKKLIKIKAEINYSASVMDDTTYTNSMYGMTEEYKGGSSTTRSGQLFLNGEWEIHEDKSTNSILIAYNYDPNDPTDHNYATGHNEIKATGGYDEKYNSSFTRKINGTMDGGENRADLTTCKKPGKVDLNIQIFQKNVNGLYSNFSINTEFAGTNTISGTMYTINPDQRYSNKGWFAIDDGGTTEETRSVGASGSNEDGDATMSIKPTTAGYIITGQYSVTSTSGMVEKTWYTITLGDDEPKDVEVKNLETSHPHCVITDSTNKVVELTAVAKAGVGQIDIDSFEVKQGSKPCIVVKNMGGKNPILVLKGCAKTTDKITVTAIYRKGGKHERSEPFVLNWVFLEKPKFPDKPTDYNSYMDRRENFVYSESIPGIIEIEAKTKLWLNGIENKNDVIDWEISKNDNKHLVPEGFNNGREVKFKANNLPESNDEFGIRRIKAKYESEECTIESEETELKIFFHRDLKNNPEGKDPNWAYYWKQTKAGQGIDFEVVNTIAAMPSESAVDARTMGRYDMYKGKIFLRVDFYTCGFSCLPCSNGGKAPSGMDCFALTLKHENQHKTELSGWWGAHFESYSMVDDPDGDFIPTFIENKTQGCNSMNPWSCPGRPTWLVANDFAGLFYFSVKDTEFDAYTIGCEWSVGSADKEDWSFPGHQCPPGQQGR